jgi:hypothetical protein
MSLLQWLSVGPRTFIYYRTLPPPPITARAPHSAYARAGNLKFSDGNRENLPFQRHRRSPVLWILIRIRIWIHWIHVFLGLPSPDPDPPVTGMDPDPAPDPDLSINMQKW